MSSSRKGSAGIVTGQLVTVNTDLLRDKLNRHYKRLHAEGHKNGATSGFGSQEGIFEYLWDLKEMALLEGKDSVQLPQNWLDELDDERGSSAGRGH